MQVTFEQVKKHIVFAFTLCVWGFGIATFGVLPMVLRRVSRSMQNIDYKHNETLMRAVLVQREAMNSPIELFLESQFPQGEGNFAVGGPLFMCWPLLWLIYLKLGVGRSLVFVLVQITAYVFYMGYCFMYNITNPNHGTFVLIGAFPCLTIHVLLLKVLLPWSCTIWMKAMQNMLVMLFGFLFVRTVFGMNEEFGNLTILLILIPLTRFVMCSSMRRVAERLMLDADVGSGAIAVRRDFAWCFLLVVQMLFATLSRMIVTEIRDLGSYILFLVGTMAQEIFMRVTIQGQDETIARLFGKCFRAKGTRPSKSSVVSPTKLGNGEEVCGDEVDKLENIKKEWYAVVLVGEMISEYVGIFVNLGLLFLFKDAILLQPFPAYNLEPKPFDEPMPIGRWVTSAIFQLFLEILTDIFCSIYEDHFFEFPLRRFWKAKPWLTKCLNLALGTFLGSSTAIMITFFALKTFQRSGSQCTSNNICSCAPFPGTLYGDYCQRLYPETNGLLN